ncbi:pantothenate synthetase [Salinibacterium amurskyense]|uniref:Pantothenate synthetase n=1 Tax=Salinibacterium amurskyense TaxID=205941 RepID=A0A2M9D6Q5_9MICO|nr:pantoate--beta-alanine ligase [Salinibacterium amurskyense]PJJ81404.1 pantothenate synthetase [Salinibacterium amurskyense]RLQ83404.1 pantoate--beta-alanine ligase [Salinibacterium amurskyense]GHD80606.1 pantothenate synthetase [Salinibacterium amurskyense]
MSSHPRPQVIETVAGMRDVVAHERAAGRTIALTPTLGALHQGHLAHVERAAELADVRIVSIFVNPTQFGANEDLDKYPRTMDEDLDMLGEMGVPYVFAPSVEEMYPKGPTSTTISAGQIGTMFEGKTRPGHFDGVLTVVAKLLAITSPQFVTFGQKDAQQLFLVRRMITDLNIPVQLEIIETVREEDGLALSSRNQFLDAHQREAASILSTALNAATSAADSGLDAVIAAAQGALMGESGVELDYFTVVDTDTFMPVPDGYRGPAVALVAARVGETRLIDNATLYVG